MQESKTQQRQSETKLEQVGENEGGGEGGRETMGGEGGGSFTTGPARNTDKLSQQAVKLNAMNQVICEQICE